MSNGIDTIYRPGVAVISRASAAPQGVPTDTTVGFIVGEATQGPVNVPTLITSQAQFVTIFGGRLATSHLSDGVELFFREGGATLYVTRLADGAVASTAAATDLGTNAKVTANGPGTYADGWQLAIKATTTGVGRSFKKGSSGNGNGNGGPSIPMPSRLIAAPRAPGDTFTAQLLDGDGGVLQQSLEIATTDDLVSWAASQSYITITGAAAAQALSAATYDLAGGSDGTVPVIDPDAFDATLDAIVTELGPGQIWAPGKTDPEMQAALMVHASSHDRVALLDAPQGADAPTLKANGLALRDQVTDRYASLWAPWVTVPGVAAGTVRTVPWSSIQAGMIARADAAAGHANTAAAGDNGQSFYAIGVTQTFTDAERQDLLYAGVDTVRQRYGTVRAYAFRSLADQNGQNAPWVQFNHGRLNMQITAVSEEIGEEYVFSQLDGRGLTIAAFHGELNGMCGDLFDLGALYGDTPDDAFDINTSPSVNTIETIANGELHAILAVKMSPHAELVEIEIVKVALTEALS